MTNIWDFLLQTMEVSQTAVLLLFIKWIFTDKLSPRWQYGVWILLAAKLLIPAGSSGHFMSRFVTVHLEGAKAAAEDGLHSAYTQVFAPIGDMPAVIPWLRAKPVSVTDWLFVLYAAGVLLCITGYLCSYVRLRRHLRKGEPVSATLAEKIRRTGETNGLRTCPAVRLEGVPSAFICGVFRPVMAVPAETEDLDEKIILHELLHLNYLDGLQSIFWSLMRALHWCNPFVQYVMNRIGNDMESLCDQRVLEKLTGESRREYGQILLSMTSEKYARVPGTTSISNGGKNIARRIAAIARFKQYPRGMALASVCIVLILAVPDGKILCSCPTPDFVQTCTRTADGTVWFASKKRLYRIEIED